MNTPILTVSGLQKRFNREAGFFAPFGEFVYAVNGVTFELNKTETYALPPAVFIIMVLIWKEMSAQ